MLEQPYVKEESIFGTNCLAKILINDKVGKMVKVKFLILLLLSMLLFASCGLKFSSELDEEKHNQVQYVDAKDGASQYLIYNNNRYMYGSTLDFFRVTKKEADDEYPYSLEYEDDVLVGWNGHRHFGYRSLYYSYTTDNPLFIYNRHEVYFREDYNYLEDVFEIANTLDEIVWQDMFGPEQSKIDFVNPTKIIVSSKLHPRIKTYLVLECVDNQWYMSLPHYPYTVYTPSDEFLEILFDNGIICS